MLCQRSLDTHIKEKFVLDIKNIDVKKDTTDIKILKRNFSTNPQVKL